MVRQQREIKFILKKEMKIVPTFTAEISIGLQKGYTNSLFCKDELIKVLQEYQRKLIKEKEIYLSANISECEIVLSGQVEPHLKLNFINYPKFPMKEIDFKAEVENLAKHLMDEFNQNRIVIVFHDETIMIEKSKEIDPRI